MAAAIFNEVRDKAIEELESFYLAKANQLNIGGVFYIQVERDDLNDYDTFRAAVQVTFSKANGGRYLTIPVDSRNSEFCPYKDEKSNMRLRFWHDYLHYSMLYDFSYESELQVAQYMLDEAEKAGLSSLALCILYAEMVGQVEYHRRRKTFPVNQASFIDSCVRHGVNTACMVVH